ncbi:MAG: LL-diaminopimelate aminotransferase [Cyanobacteriota bacterium]|nr:LL-diaminopimelate aminotransferase [Cyanobacteriota bacterium]
MRFADRLQSLQSNVFDQMDRAKRIGQQAGRTIIDLSIGSSDLPPPIEARHALAKAAADPYRYGYTLFHQTQAFRQACALWYEKKFGLAIDPETEVLPLMGAQQATALFPLALLNPGDGALVVDPCYPSHTAGVLLAGGEVLSMPVRAEQQFLPVFGDIPDSHRQKARLMVLSYPHNPTTATAPLSFWREAVTFCQTQGIPLIHDFPYADWMFTDQPAPSVLQVDREKTMAVEVFTLSKSYHLGGLRVGYAIGNRQLLQALGQIKSVVNFNAYQGILEAATAALQDTSPTFIEEWRDVYRRRRDVCLDALAKLGWIVPTPQATMYLWAPLPPGYHGSSAQFCEELVIQTGVALAPGSGFGQMGEGYVRFALVEGETQLRQAVALIGNFLPL